MPSVLITRPRAASESLAQELTQLGYQPVVEPLLSIEPLATSRAPGSVDAVMITSSNALTALDGRRAQLSDLFDAPCFCVGQQTAEHAAAFGFHNVRNSESDGTALAQLAGHELGKIATVLHIAGRDVDGKAGQALERLGHRVTVWPVYKASPASAFTSPTQLLLKQQKLDAVVVFSPRTAETLVRLLQDATLEACCASLAAICLSDAVARVLKPLNWRHLKAASVPTESAVITLLQELCPVKP